MTEIIVGVDGSDSSRVALRWAATHGRSTGSSGSERLPPGSIPRRPRPRPDPRHCPGRTRWINRPVTGSAAWWVTNSDSSADPVEIEAGRGPASTVLLGAAARNDADMLVVGARGLGGFSGLLLGSVSQQCVEYSPCPVVVLRGDSDAADGPIVVGLDGSEGATRALHWTIDLAAATGSPIVAVHATGPGPNNAMMDAARQRLDQWCTPIETRAVRYEMRVEHERRPDRARGGRRRHRRLAAGRRVQGARCGTWAAPGQRRRLRGSILHTAHRHRSPPDGLTRERRSRRHT